jgi:aminoglycoside 6'-N-acetyltransferase I
MSEIRVERRTEEPLPFDLLLLADPSRDMIDRYLNHSEVYLAKTGDEIIGILVLVRTGKSAEIMNVAVCDNYQRKGIGSQLIRYAIDVAKSMDLQKLYIGTADTSLNQLTLYQKLGFKRVDRLVNFFVENYDEPILENGKQAKDMIRLEMSLT